jgi:hypothetical protein
MVVKDQNFLLSILAIPIRGRAIAFQPVSLDADTRAATIQIPAFTNCLPQIGMSPRTARTARRWFGETLIVLKWPAPIVPIAPKHEAE